MNRFSIPSWIRYSILFSAAFLFVFLFSTTTSPFYSDYHYWFHGDSGIFQEMGLCIVYGKTPYVDLFDHKGPLLFFIEALGLWINLYWGIFVIQTISLFGTLVIWYKTIELFNFNTIKIFAIELFALFALVFLFQRGNLSEDWSLPFISLPIYILCKSLIRKNDISWHSFMIIGFCIGSLMFIRANNLLPISGFIILYYFIQIKNSNFKELINNTIFLTLGIATVWGFWILFFLVFYSTDALKEMLFGTFIFNFEYLNTTEENTIQKKVIFYAPILIMAVLNTLQIKKDKKSLPIAATISYILTWGFLGDNLFIHYHVLFIPLYIITLCLFFNNNKRWHVFLILLTIILIIRIDNSGIDILAFKLKGNKPDTTRSDDFKRFLSSIDESELQSIYNWSAPSFLFAENKVLQANRILMYTHYLKSERLRNYEHQYGMIEKQSKWVLIDNYVSLDIEDYDFLHNNYSIEDSIWNEENTIYCWHKNNVIKNDNR